MSTYTLSLVMFALLGADLAGAKTSDCAGELQAGPSCSAVFDDWSGDQMSLIQARINVKRRHTHHASNVNALKRIETVSEATEHLSLLAETRRFADVQSTLKTVQKLAEASTKGEFQADPITAQVLQDITDSMTNDIINFTSVQHVLDETSLTQAEDVIEDCTTTMHKAFEGSTFHAFVQQAPVSLFKDNKVSSVDTSKAFRLTYDITFHSYNMLSQWAGIIGFGGTNYPRKPSFWGTLGSQGHIHACYGTNEPGNNNCCDTVDGVPLETEAHITAEFMDDGMFAVTMQATLPNGTLIDLKGCEIHGYEGVELAADFDVPVYMSRPEYEAANATVWNVFYTPIVDGEPMIGGGVHSLEEALAEAHEAHDTCRMVQHDLNTTKDDICNEFEAFSNDLEHSKPDFACNFPKPITGPPFPEDDDIVEALEELSHWAEDHKHMYLDLKDHCMEHYEILMKKKDSCDTSQSVFESTFCSYETALVTTCDAYTDCHSAAILNFNEVKTAVNESEKSLKADYQAAKNVLCYISVLNATDSAEKKQKLDACHGELYDTSHLDILYPAVSPPEECETEHVQNKPCDDAFVANMYTSQPWYSWAPTITCSACASSSQYTISPVPTNSLKR